MAQLPLFGGGRRTLADDSRGRIDYFAEFVDPATALAWFETLRETVPWETHRRRMYDRDVDVPRLSASYRLSSQSVPPLVEEAARRVRSELSAPFDSVGLNFYRDGRDSVAPHNDHLYEISPGYSIALISLGATRRMTIRTKEAPRLALDLDLENGSLLVMSYATQMHYDHGIPKVSEAIDSRISMAFRVRQL